MHIIVETTLAISSLRNVKELMDPYKDHPFHHVLVDKKTLIVTAEQDNDSKDEEEQTKAEPNLDTYKPLVPYP